MKSAETTSTAIKIEDLPMPDASMSMPMADTHMSDAPMMDAPPQQHAVFPFPSEDRSLVSQQPTPDSYRQMAAHQLANKALEAQQRANHMEFLADAVRRGDPVPLDKIRVMSPKNSSGVGVPPSGLGHFPSHPGHSDTLVNKAPNDGDLSLNPTVAPIRSTTLSHTPLPHNTLPHNTLPHLDVPAGDQIDKGSLQTFGLSSIDNEIMSLMQRHRAEQDILQSQHQIQMQQLHNLRLIKAEEERVLQVSVDECTKLFAVYI